jgi:hypothetical protein
MEDNEREDLVKLVETSGAKGVLRLTMTVDFIVPAHEHRSLNTVAKEWFEKFHLAQYHAYRDGSKIGWSEKMVEYEIVN